MWGHAVTLVTKPPAQLGAPLAESLTPSCGKFFDLLGIHTAIDDAGFVRTTGNTVWWGPGDARVETFGNGAAGWQVTSTALEGVMLATAEEAGVRVERAMLTPEDAAARPAVIRLDCTGRTGLLARSRAGRRMEEGHRTVSLSAVWERRNGWGLPDASHTLIESYADGWAWSVPLDAARRAVAVMVDPRITSMKRGDGAAATYRAELDKTERLRVLLAEATMLGGPTGWDASMYSSTTYAGDDWLVVGDAASFVDPLSSAGVKKALASGWLAAIVTHTALSTPGMAATARQFFADREAEVYATFLSLTRGYLHEAAEGQAHPFWAERAETGERDAVRMAAEQEREGVHAAFERLKAAPQLIARPGADVRLERRPAIGGNEIVMEPRLVTPTDPVGVRYLHDVDVVTMVELAPTCRQVPDLFDAYVKRAGPVDLGGFVTALATAVARRWVDLC
jgi:flavin-dependent dehydrogenase